MSDFTSTDIRYSAHLVPTPTNSRTGGIDTDCDLRRNICRRSGLFPKSFPRTHPLRLPMDWTSRRRRAGHRRFCSSSENWTINVARSGRALALGNLAIPSATCWSVSKTMIGFLAKRKGKPFGAAFLVLAGGALVEGVEDGAGAAATQTESRIFANVAIRWANQT